jgi:hypothetical protein
LRKSDPKSAQVGVSFSGSTSGLQISPGCCGIAGLLEEMGVGGVFDLYQVAAPKAPVDLRDPMVRADLLECRLRVRGEPYRYRPDGFKQGWRPTSKALLAGVEATLAWALQAPARPFVTLHVHTTATPVRRGTPPPTSRAL